MAITRSLLMAEGVLFGIAHTEFSHKIEAATHMPRTTRPLD